MKITIGLPMLLLALVAMACQQKPIQQKVTPPSGAIATAEAAQHVGEVQTVYGTVASARYVYWTRGQPTFLNLDEPHPHQVFTIVIWNLTRERFGFAPEERFLDKAVCVTGLIEEEEGIPRIVVKELSQIQILKPSRPGQPQS
ncbi:MAG: hypothetical protein JSU61_08370 [Fidelibacterota bacterium]|nr:MAG: hypothetical protein JSU61_08370 [Candidatus Neomarinimicrobiota bacterium]